jgi:hypothetical protein
MQYKKKYQKYKNKIKDIIGGNLTLDIIMKYIDNKIKQEDISKYDLILGFGTCTDQFESEILYRYFDNINKTYVAILIDPSYNKIGTGGVPICNNSFLESHFTSDLISDFSDGKNRVYTKNENKQIIFIVNENMPMDKTDDNRLLWNYARDCLVKNNMNEYFKSFNDIQITEKEEDLIFMQKLKNMMIKFKKINVYNQIFFNERHGCYYESRGSSNPIAPSHKYCFLCGVGGLELCSHEKKEFRKYGFEEIHNDIEQRKNAKSPAIPTAYFFQRTLDTNVFFEKMPLFIKILNQLLDSNINIYILYNVSLTQSHIFSFLQDQRDRLPREIQQQQFYSFSFPNFKLK